MTTDRRGGKNGDPGNEVAAVCIQYLLEPVLELYAIPGSLNSARVNYKVHAGGTGPNRFRFYERSTRAPYSLPPQGFGPEAQRPKPEEAP